MGQLSMRLWFFTKEFVHYLDYDSEGEDCVDDQIRQRPCGENRARRDTQIIRDTSEVRMGSEGNILRYLWDAHDTRESATDWGRYKLVFRIKSTRHPTHVPRKV
jgi:hypothetical protein